MTRHLHLLPGTLPSEVRTIISLAAVFRWKLHQMDVKTAFLNGKIEEEVILNNLKAL